MLRGFALGKPVNQHLRSVSGSDSSLKLGEFHFPMEYSSVVTRRLRITSKNLGSIQHMCHQGITSVES